MTLASVGVFQDREREILVIPSWRKNDGPWIDSMKYTVKHEPYSEEELGKTILQAIEISKQNEQEDMGQNAFQKASGLKSWNAFQKKYENVMISVLNSGEWNIARWLKQKDHSYGLDKDDVDKYTKIFPEALSAEELGKVVLEMFAME